MLCSGIVVRVRPSVRPISKVNKNTIYAMTRNIGLIVLSHEYTYILNIGLLLVLVPVAVPTSDHWRWDGSWVIGCSYRYLNQAWIQGGGAGGLAPPPPHKKLLPQIVRRGSRGAKRALPPPYKILDPSMSTSFTY